MKDLTHLQQAVLKQLNHEDEDGYTLKDVLCDVCEHGADTGWNGFTYYADTIAFTKANRKAIETLVREQADDQGKHPVDFIASFRCLDRSDPALREAIGRFIYGGHYQNSTKCDSPMVYNALAWYALEETARALIDQ